jgi:DNA polymerase I-like protein with 3'-5' exonuclease and polymerase domains
MRCATASVSSHVQNYRSPVMAAIVRAYFLSAPPSGRNAHAKSLYNAHACVRSFMVFPPDTIGLYLDWRTQEVGVAAALSEDPAPIDAYNGGDVYYTLARDCGLTSDPDRKRWKREYPGMRQRMKSLQLGINYGMGVPSLAKGLDRHPIIASNFIERHRRKYSRFRQWREDQVQAAMLERRIETMFGWPLRISTARTNAHSTIFRCKVAALKCCDWRRGGCVRLELYHAC